MLQFLFDTHHLTLFGYGHAKVVQKHAAQLVGSTGISAVTIEEVMRGRLAALSRATTGAMRVQGYAWLVSSVKLFERFNIVPYDDASESEFQQLRSRKLRIGTPDLKIAAVALANNLILLTRNRRDFGLVPGLKIDDWSV
jgi:tRNA(fMet)-specific endonuclease VapC